MAYRITEVSHDPAKRDEIFAFMDSKRSEIKSIPGFISMDVIEIDEGKSTAITRYDSEASAAAAESTAQAILGGMKDMMTAPPDRKGGGIVWSL